MNAQAPFLAFVSDSKDIETLKAFAESQQWPDSCIMQGDVKTATEFLKTHSPPVLLLVEIPSAAETPPLLDALAEYCSPETKVVAIGIVNEYSFYCWLMEVGIFSYLLRPLTKQMLESTYQKAVEKPLLTGKPEKQPGKIIAVLGSRGGVGATTIALSLAGIIADLAKKQVALVDVDPQEGSIALTLDLEPSRGFREALEKPDRIDSLFIERVMSKPNKYLSILSSEESLQDKFPIHEEASDALLKEMREKFDVIVLDVPRHLNDFSRKCLAMADHVVLVTELTLLNLRDTLRMNDLIRESLKMKQPPLIVANRVGLAPKMAVKQADFEKGIGSKVDFMIPFSPELYMQITTDISVLKFKEHAAARPMYQLAERLVPEAKTLLASLKQKKGFSLFKGKGKPEEKAAEGKPAEEKPTEDKADNKPAENKAEEKPAESKSEEKKE